MKIYDVSMDINYCMPVYKNKDEKKPIINRVQDFLTASSYESKITMDMHTGTHLDAPLHMIDGGKNIDTIPLEKFIRNCKVIDFTEIEEKITKDNLVQKDIQKDDFIILKTKNSYIDKFDDDFAFLDKSGAKYLKEIGIQGIGIDALGIERNQPEHETHKILLGAEIIILEGLRLKEVEEGEYFLYAPPLKINEVEAAPTRAVLVKMDK